MDKKSVITAKTIIIVGSSVVILLLIILISAFTFTVLENKESLKDEMYNIYQLKVLIYVIITCLGTLTIGLFALVYNLPYWLLFIVLTFTCITIMELINLTGGLTNSPFTSMYAALTTITILIHNRIRSLIIALVILLLFILCNLFHQQFGFYNKINTDSFLYKKVYAFVLFLLLFILSFVDYCSKNYERIPFIRDVYRRLHEKNQEIL